MVILDDVDLTEDAAEGYHRGARLSKEHAAASTREKIVVDQRQNQNFDRIQGFMDAHGELGVQAFRYEWTNFKRLVQTGTGARQLSRPKAMQDRPFFERMYRMDDPAQLEWHNLITNESHANNQVAPRDAVRVEYLAKLFQRNVTYGYQRREPEAIADGPEWTYFQVVDVRTSHSRPKVVKTADSMVDKHMHSPLSLACPTL